jgi:hypothetical protein
MTRHQPHARLHARRSRACRLRQSIEHAAGFRRRWERASGPAGRSRAPTTSGLAAAAASSRPTDPSKRLLDNLVVYFDFDRSEMPTQFNQHA